MAVDIPNYRVVEKLGVGAQTRVYRARCMRTGKDYAVKIVKIRAPEDAKFLDLLKEEYDIARAVDHPVIRKAYELRMLRRRLRVHGAILFMEYVPGITMSDREFKRSTEDVLRLFVQAAQGLHAMHVAGFVHADLKPNNMIVTPDEQLKLIDLGQSAKMHEAKSRVQGTIDYMAPEQIQRKTLDQRTDVFGLGAALHRVLTGRPIATGMNQSLDIHSSSLLGRRAGELQDGAGDDLPACVSKLIGDCCHPAPSDRIHDMTALVERLQLALAILTKTTIFEDDDLADESIVGFDVDELLADTGALSGDTRVEDPNDFPRDARPGDVPDM